MNKNEPRTNLIYINYAIMVYKPKVGTIETHKSTRSLKIQFLSWFNIPLKRINCIPIPFINNNDEYFY